MFGNFIQSWRWSRDAKTLVFFKTCISCPCVRCQEPKTFNAKGDINILVVDCGMKLNQIRCLCVRGARVKIVPWNFPLSSASGIGCFLKPVDGFLCTVAFVRLYMPTSEQAFSVKLLLCQYLTDN